MILPYVPDLVMYNQGMFDKIIFRAGVCLVVFIFLCSLVTPNGALASTKIPTQLGTEKTFDFIKNGESFKIKLPDSWGLVDTKSNTDKFGWVDEELVFANKDNPNKASISLKHLIRNGVTLSFPDTASTTVIGGRTAPSSIIFSYGNEKLIKSYLIPNVNGSFEGDRGYYVLTISVTDNDVETYRKLLERSISSLVFVKQGDKRYARGSSQAKKKVGSVLSQRVGQEENIVVSISPTSKWSLTTCDSCLAIERKFNGTDIVGSITIVEKDSAGVSWEQAKKYFVSGTLASITAKSVKKGKMKIGGLDAIYVEYTLGGLRYKEVAFAKNGVVFYVTAQTPVSKWRQSKNEIEKSLQTIQISDL